MGGGTGIDEWMKIDDSDRKRIPMKDLEYYMMHSVVRRGLWFKAMSISGKGFTFVHEKDEIKDLCYEFTNTPNYGKNLTTGVFQSLGFGEGYVENLWDDTFKELNNVVTVDVEGTELTGTAITDPKTFTPISDSKGEIEKYVQKIVGKGGTTRKIYFPARRILYITFDHVGGSIRGYGLLEPAVPIVKGLIMTRKTRFSRLFRMGNPFLHATYKKKEMTDLINRLDLQTPKGKKKIGPKEMLERQLKNANEKSLLITSDLYTLEWLGIQDSAIDLEPILISLYMELAGSFGIPLSVLTQSGKEQNRAVLDRISYWDQEENENYQEMLSDSIKHQQLRPLLDAKGYENEDVPDIEWNVISEEKNEKVYGNDKVLVDYLTQATAGAILSQEDATAILSERLGQVRESMTETTPSVQTPEEAQTKDKADTSKDTKDAGESNKKLIEKDEKK